MSEGRGLVSQAVKDAKELRAAALEAAKNEIVEQLAPGIKQLLEANLQKKLDAESVDRVNSQGADYYGPASREKEKKFQEAAQGDDKMADEKKNTGKPGEEELDLESLSAMFPQLAEEPDEAQQIPGGIPTLGEEPQGFGSQFPEFGKDGVPSTDDPDHRNTAAGVPPKKEAKTMPSDAGDDVVDEQIEISESELRKVYEDALKLEVNVSKGFKDMTKSGELSEVDPAGGIADFKKGETTWDEKGALPPAKQDWTVKEMLIRGLAENKSLRGKLREAAKLIQMLGTKLHEVNLFNSKVLHVNRILNQSGRLTTEHKKVVMESIDKARSIDEVRTIYETIVASFKASQTLHESRNPRIPKANAQRPRSSGEADQKVLSESVDKSNGMNVASARFRQLAGITG